MGRSTNRALALAGLCLLAACGPKGGASSGQAPAAIPANGSNGSDVQLSFADLPRPRAGLWRTTLDNGRGHLLTDDHCLSGKAPNIGRELRFGHGGCEEASLRRTLSGAIVMDMTCSSPGFTMTSHTVATGDFQTTMTSDSQMTLSAGHMAARTLKFHSEAHWVGPCPPGQRASDEPQQAAG